MGTIDRQHYSNEIDTTEGIIMLYIYLFIYFTFLRIFEQLD